MSAVSDALAAQLQAVVAQRAAKRPKTTPRPLSDSGTPSKHPGLAGKPFNTEGGDRPPLISIPKGMLRGERGSRGSFATPRPGTSGSGRVV